MGGTVQAYGPRRWARLVVLMLAVIGVLGGVAPAALAFDPIDTFCDNGVNYAHGDMVLETSCGGCHDVVPVDPSDPKANTLKCLSCHYGGYENRPVESGFDTCWSCHNPGQNQDVVQNEVEGQAFDGCAAAIDCHAVDPAANLPHYGANTKSCTDGCHRVSSQSIPNGSPHHDDGLANCYDCHDGARALEKVHEPYTAVLDITNGGPFCYSCHDGYKDSHPAPGAIVHRTMEIKANPLTVNYGGTTVVSGSLTLDGQPAPIITLLGRPVLALDWITLQSKTATSTGAYAFAAETPAKNTTYSSMTKGKYINADKVYKPVRSSVLVKVAPVVTESLKPTSFALGGTITVTGKVVPSKTAGKVKWVFQRYIDGAWRTVTTTATKLLIDVDVADPGVDYSTAGYAYKPAKKGSWRVKTTFVATTEYTTASSVYKTFTVK